MAIVVWDRGPGLGVLVSLVGVVAMVPYLAVQFQGFGIKVSEASYGSISSTAAMVIGMVAATVYVIISGIRCSGALQSLGDVRQEHTVGPDLPLAVTCHAVATPFSYPGSEP